MRRAQDSPRGGGTARCAARTRRPETLPSSPEPIASGRQSGIEPKVTFIRCGDDRPGDGVLRRLLEGPNDASISSCSSRARSHIRSMPPRHRQRAGFVEDDGARPRQRLERGPPFIRMSRRRARDAAI